MATIPAPERAVVCRARNPPAEPEPLLFLALQAPQTTLQRRWILKLVTLFLNKLPPTQPALPNILPQFNPPQRSLAMLAQRLRPLPRRTIALPEEQSMGTSPTQGPSVHPPTAPKATPVFDSIYERYRRQSMGTSPTQGPSVHPPTAPNATPVFDSIYERYERHLWDLKNILSPLTRDDDDGSNDDHRNDDSGCVLLCWGSSTNCRVLAVNHISRTIDQEMFWKKLQSAWYDARGRWRQRMPWYGIRSVKQVEVRLVGPDPDARDVFHGVWRLVDAEIEAEKQELLERVSTSKLERESTFSDYPEPDPWGEDNFESYPCRYDYKRGFTDHNPLCCDTYQYCGDPDYEIPDPTCPVEERQKDREKLDRLAMEPLRTLLFQNPKLAVYNELENADLVYSSE